MLIRRAVPILGLCLTLALLSACATKKYVKQEIAVTQADLQKKIDEEASRRADLGNQVQELSSLNKTNSARIETVQANLDKNVKTMDPRIDDAKKTGVEARATADAAMSASKENTAAILVRNNYAIVSTDAVYFKSGSAALDDKAKATLESMAKTIVENKNLVLELQGFTDSVGDAKSNLQLSNRRVESVLRHLVGELKVDLYRISTLGLGEDNPVEANKTRDGRAKNRRVELRVLGVK